MVVLKEEISSLKDQLLRRRAEFDNYRRRVERDQRAASEDAVISMLSDLLPSMDALEKALLANGTLDEIRAGLEITLKDISSTLASRGVRIEDPTGERFDPLRHQALSYEPVLGAEDGSIVACYRKGYIMGERLIRPALVKVAQQATEEHPLVVVPVSH
jgi:molecular chaperone GrpE